MQTLTADCQALSPRCRGASRRRIRACVTRCTQQAQPTQPAAETTRRLALISAASTATLLWTATCGCRQAAATDNEADDLRVGRIAHTEAEWRAMLGPSYAVVRKASTELPWSSELVKEHREGTYCCAGCGTPLFLSSAKYESGTGWPSFYDVIPGAVRETSDKTIPFVPRIEVRCAACEGHTGHVFNDGPLPTGLRYCMNGKALVFKPMMNVASLQ